MAWSDHHHMRHALALAERAIGHTADNPAVGCVLVKQDRIIGRGVTQPSGRPHAEVVALAQAQERAQGATAYVTLEPCAHRGRTGPCAKALIDAQVARVCIGIQDPDPRVSGRGIEMLRSADIEVTVGLERDRAERQLAGFLMRTVRNRPSISLKIATSLDGKIATRTGNSQWITGPAARAHGHMLRARHDAIMIAAGTATADNPSLTCRLPGLMDQSPIRIILDRRGETPPDSEAFRSAGTVPTWIVTETPSAVQTHSGSHVRVIETSEDEDIEATLSTLAREGVKSILVDGGAGLAGRLMSAGCVDLLYLYQAGKILGADGFSAVGQLGFDLLPDTQFVPLGAPLRLKEDQLTIFRKKD